MAEAQKRTAPVHKPTAWDQISERKEKAQEKIMKMRLGHYIVERKSTIGTSKNPERLMFRLCEGAGGRWFACHDISTDIEAYKTFDEYSFLAFVHVDKRAMRADVSFEEYKKAYEEYSLGDKMNEIQKAFGGSPIVEVTTTVLDIGMIRLKFLGLPGDVGPELIMDEALARTTIAKLQECLPEYSAKPTIVCLCGSTRFYKEYMTHNLLETLKGNVVLSVGGFGRADAKWLADTYSIEVDNVSAQPKDFLDELHKRKIEMCDEVLVLNPDGYVGESTRAEIWHAKRYKKTIRSLAPLPTLFDIEQEL